VARGARRTRSRFAGGLEPLTHARVEYFEHERRELVRLGYVEPIRSPLGSPDGEALSYASYFAELVDASAPDGDPNERLYRLGASVVDALVAGVSTERLARYFEYWLFRIQGVYPSIVSCHRCGKTLERGAYVARPAGVLWCTRCGTHDGEVDLSPEALAFLRGVAVVSPDRIDDLSVTPAGLRQLATAHRALMAIHLEREPRSTRVLHEIGIGSRPGDTEAAS